MRTLNALLLSAILTGTAVWAPSAMAQTAAADQPIEQRMSADEFRAAGLNKLTPTELAALNQWLNGTLKVETAKATQSALQTAKAKAQGFFDFDGKRESIHARLVGDFRGFSQGRVYKLDNGQEWEQTESSELHVRLTNPKVEMRPGILNSWWMIVEGYNTRAKVRRVK